MKDFENELMKLMREERTDETGAKEVADNRKTGRGGRRGMVKTMAGLCAACVVLSGAFGFGGTYLANRMSRMSMTAENGAAVTETQTERAARSSFAASSVSTLERTEDAASVLGSAGGSELTYAQVAAMVKDSVVEINTEYTTRNAWFQYTTGGAGSGVILSEDGYIVTNAHVILDENMQNAADSVKVRLTDGEEYDAEVKAYDSDEDIAILKIEAEGLTPARCGDSDKLVVGEELIIVGNPLGELGGSVSNGIVSATEREIQVGGVTMRLIQTNAAVNPGNSGGGMFNMKGELVGIVNAKSSGTGIEGIGFAIPINRAMDVSDQLMETGYVSGKPMIGVSLENVTGNGWFFSSDVKAGVYVRGLSKGMNDDVLKIGDRIIAVNGEEVGSSADVKAVVSEASVGGTLTVELYRDGELMEVEIKVFERTQEAMDALTSATKTGEEAEKEPADTDKETETEKPEGKKSGRDSGDSENGGTRRSRGTNGSEKEKGEDSGTDEDDAPETFEIPASLADLFGSRG